MTVALGPPAVRDFTAMGTSCRVIVAREDEAALERAQRWVERTAGRLTRFDEDSELCRLNRAAGHWTPISPLLEQLLRTALWAYERSGGLVHAGVLPSLLGLGYRRPFRERRLLPIPAVPPAPPPPLPVMLTLRRGAARLRRGTAIDLGGIAKGWMADRLAARLDQPCVVNLGGDLFASAGDSARDGAGWPVDVGGDVLTLCDQGAATSSVRHRAWSVGERRVHHLIDPRTGSPAATGVAQVQLVATSALEAEVLAKEALLLGPAAGRALLRRHAAAWRLELDA